MARAGEFPHLALDPRRGALNPAVTDGADRTSIGKVHTRWVVPNELIHRENLVWRLIIRRCRTGNQQGGTAAPQYGSDETGSEHGKRSLLLEELQLSLSPSIEGRDVALWWRRCHR